MSAISYMQLPYLQSAVMGLSAAQLDTVWLSQLAYPGLMLKRSCLDKRWWVLSVSPHGVLVWPLQRVLVGRDDLWVWSADAPSADRAQYLHIHDEAAWEATPLRGVPPIAVPMFGGQQSLVLEAKCPPTPLIQVAARIAFKGWTVVMLKKLVKHSAALGPGQSMPNTLEQLLRLMIGHALPGLSDAEVDDIVRLRSKNEASTDESALQPNITEANAHLCAAVLEEDNSEVEERARKTGRTNRPSTTPPTAAAAVPNSDAASSSTAPPLPGPGAASSSTAPPLPAPGAAPSSTAGPSSVGPRDRSSGVGTAADDLLRLPGGGFALRPSAGDIWTKQEAATLIPRATGCSITIIAGTRWSLYYRNRATDGKKSDHHAWGVHTGLSHKEALQACLRWGWEVHFECTGEACPFDIDAL